MPRISRRSSSRALRSGVVLLLLVGCDVIGGAYDCGYQAGYGTADAILDDVARREASRDAWEAACADHAPLDATTQQQGDDACDERGGFGSRLTACEDPGDNRDTLPNGCSPFEETGFGNDGFGCPDGVSGLCLCCDRDRQECDLAGDFCVSDTSCCSGFCVLEDVADAGTSTDAGPAPAPRGACQ